MRNMDVCIDVHAGTGLVRLSYNNHEIIFIISYVCLERAINYQQYATGYISDT